MLSKEKIEAQSQLIKSTHHPNLTKEVNEGLDGLARLCYSEGATWASEQYAVVVKELKGLLQRWNLSELSMEYLEETFPILEEELYKLNHP